MFPVLVFSWFLPVSLFTWNSMFLKSEGVSNLKPVVPSVQQFFSGVVVHHIAAVVRSFVQYIWVPLFSCLGVVSKVDGSGLGTAGINTVDHSTGHKGIGYRAHYFCAKIDGLDLSWIQCFT